MSSAAVTVNAPSRLHLGMFAFGKGHHRQFGGVGVMIDEPRLQISIHPAEKFSCTGPHAARSAQIARQVAAKWLEEELPACEVVIEAAPPEHAGLGLGTQLSLAIGVGLTRYAAPPRLPPPEEIAVKLGRAQRSSVGTHGFVHGGLIVEAGHAAGEPLGPLVQRLAIPESWRVVLIVPHQTAGLSGTQESQAFAELPPVSPDVTGRLTSEVLLQMLPAVRSGNFAAFSQSVYAFGKLAGSCFAAAQGGPFAARAAPIVERLRSIGISGVGQSSWGPAVFAWTEDEASAANLRQRLLSDPPSAACDIILSRPNACGAGASIMEGR